MRDLLNAPLELVDALNALEATGVDEDLRLNRKVRDIIEAWQTFKVLSDVREMLAIARGDAP